ncbi:uncharacterized protein BX663DRAFT_492749 [Cokeromyces recurvatus]|uniref:uncharacterized protein n=1 Tax=Cokeromyces recurvatus TaxID=90255 RepID=UPI0022202497|nr:uncharacterized protein BX663DRAFT_492749 [Cokeromyces recurvatus]KAI7908025.1 hypothetical protein BX663DRAFT_492749 [Cokeromyces recurvatus]
MAATTSMVSPSKSLITPNSVTSQLNMNSGMSELQNIQNSLIEAFGQICSVEQMEVCQKLGMLSKYEQQQAYKMARALIEHRQLPVTIEDWNHLTEWVLTLRDRYNMQLESQCIRQHASDLERISHLDQVQRISGLLEEYGQAHEDLTDLLQALKKLRNDWKHRKRDVENIVLSILASAQLKFPAYRVVKVTRSHLATLGLGFSSIGKYYIIYESCMSDESKKEVLNNIAKDFSMVFQENAAQNLARMAGSYHRIFQQEEDIDVLDEIQKLIQKVFIIRPKSVILPYPTSLPTAPSPSNGSSSNNHIPHLNRRNSSFLERRKSIIILENNQEQEETNTNEENDGDFKMPMVFNMAKPVFQPAGWDWPHILKHKRPRTKSSGNSNGSYYWCKQFLSSSSYSNTNNANERETTLDDHSGVWSTSISRLSEHFAKIGYDYYSNMLNNATLMHSHRAQMFEFATHSLMKTYRALQLEQGCANLSRTLVFLYKLQQEAQRT